MCLFAGVLAILPHEGMPGSESMRAEMNATISLEGTNLCTRHFPVKNIRNPDLTGRGYTLNDDSASITKIGKNTLTSAVQLEDYVLHLLKMIN